MRISTFYDPPSFFFSSRQIHNAAINAISTPGATVTAYVCCPKKISLPLNSFLSILATTASGIVSVPRWLGENLWMRKERRTTLSFVGDVGCSVEPVSAHSQDFLFPGLTRERRGGF